MRRTRAIGIDDFGDTPHLSDVEKPCARWVTVKGTFSIPAQAGATSFTFRGRIGDKKLKPGSYRLNSRATDSADNTSATKRKTFRIVK